MCRKLSIIFDSSPCNRLCTDPSLTPRVIECEYKKIGRRCYLAGLDVAVPIHCPRHRRDVINPKIDEYYRTVSAYTTASPTGTGVQVKKTTLLHPDVASRIFSYLTIRRMELSILYAEAIRDFSEDFGMPTGKSAGDYRLLEDFAGDMDKALALFRDDGKVKPGTAPIDLPGDVLDLFWKTDDPRRPASGT